MKAISIKQPWAWLIVFGFFDVKNAEFVRKDIENRDRKTSHRGPIFIHASKTFDYEGYEYIRDEMELDIPVQESNLYHRGGIVGRADIVDCVKDHTSIWAAVDKWNWILTNQIELPFVLYPGMPGMFDI